MTTTKKQSTPTLMSMRIRALRKEHDILQSELAEKLNTTSSNVSNYESGKTVPPIDKIKTMADIFKVPIDYLTGDSDSRVYKEERRFIEVDNYIGELIRELDDTNNTFKLDGLPITQDAQTILKMNLEHTLNIIKVQQASTFNKSLK